MRIFSVGITIGGVTITLGTVLSFIWVTLFLAIGLVGLQGAALLFYVFHTTPNPGLLTPLVTLWNVGSGVQVGSGPDGGLFQELLYIVFGVGLVWIWRLLVVTFDGVNRVVVEIRDNLDPLNPDGFLGGFLFFIASLVAPVVETVLSDSELTETFIRNRARRAELEADPDVPYFKKTSIKVVYIAAVFGFGGILTLAAPDWVRPLVLVLCLLFVLLLGILVELPAMAGRLFSEQKKRELILNANGYLFRLLALVGVVVALAVTCTGLVTYPIDAFIGKDTRHELVEMVRDSNRRTLTQKPNVRQYSSPSNGADARAEDIKKRIKALKKKRSK